MHSNGSDFWWCIQATKEERDGKMHHKSQAAGTAAAGKLHKPAKIKGDLNKERGVFAYSRKPGDCAEVDQRQVQVLIQRRSTMREKGDFAAADTIMETLRNDFHVVVDDRTKTWEVRILLITVGL